MTGRDVISASLKLIGALAPGESLAANEATDGLATLNRMIGSWSNEKLTIFAKVREEFTLTANDGIYSMGSGADFNTTRPQFIENATIEDQSVSPTVEYPLRILRSQDEWAGVAIKDLTSTYPQYLYAEGTFPNETINLWPVPTAANKLVLYTLKPLTEISTLDTSLSFPPGYEEALVFNLALRLAPEYGRIARADVIAIATEGKAAIKRTNDKPRFLRIDGIPAAKGSSFNIHTGDYR